MTLPTTNLRLRYIPVCFLTVSTDLHTALKASGHWTGDRRPKLEKFTGIGKLYPRHRAGTAKIGCPAEIVRLQKAAFLHITPAIIIPEKILAFLAGRCTHNVDVFPGVLLRRRLK